jgi:hypothetical protein
MSAFCDESLDGRSPPCSVSVHIVMIVSRRQPNLDAEDAEAGTRSRSNACRTSANLSLVGCLLQQCRLPATPADRVGLGRHTLGPRGFKRRFTKQAPVLGMWGEGSDPAASQLERVRLAAIPDHELSRLFRRLLRERPPVALQRRLPAGRILPALHDHIDVSRIEFDQARPSAGALGGDQGCA